jgi:chitinase
MTHLIFFSVEPTAEGGITGMDRFPPADVLDAARGQGCQLIICFGGNGRSSGFSAMTRNPTARKAFVKKVKQLVKRFKLDGVDYNWEYPGYGFGTGYSAATEVQKDYDGLLALLQDTRQVMPKKTLSVAYYPDTRQEQILVAIGAPELVDFLHIMAYDQHSDANTPSHSSYDFAQQVLRQGKDLSLPAAKLTLGVPFYGRDSATGDWTTYEDLVQQHHPLDRSVDTVTPPADKKGRGRGRNRNGVPHIAFNGIDTIQAKTRLAVEEGIGGVMIWEVGQDCRVAPVTRGGQTHAVTCPEGEDSSLLVAIDRVLKEEERSRRGAGTDTDTDTGIAHDASSVGDVVTDNSNAAEL